MPRAVAVVEARGPQRPPRVPVQHEARGVLGEYQGRERDVALQHRGVGRPLEVGGLPQVHGAGHVRGAALVLSPRVQEEHAVRPDLAVLSLLGAVVDDGAVGPLPHNCGERWLDVSRISRAEAAQHNVRGSLPHGLAGGNEGLEPMEESRHCEAVAEVRLSHPRELGVVLDGLGRLDGRSPADHPAASRRGLLRRHHDGEGRARLIHQYRCAARGLRHDVLEEGLVWAHGDPAFLQVCRHLGRYLGRVDVEARGGGVHIRIGDHHGVALHVGPADVVEPRHLIEHGRQHGRCIILRRGGPHGLDLVLDALSRKLHRMHARWARGHRGLRGAPHRVHGVSPALEGGEHATALLKRGGEVVGSLDAVEVGVDAHLATGGEHVHQPLGDLRHSRHPRLHKVPPLPQLVLRLEEVAPVRPQGRLVQGDHSRASGSCEPRDERAAVPARGRVLRLVGIFRGYDEGFNAPGAHLLTEGLETIATA
mmetsp:Transcript_24998/g.79222  ORF Transcript_24998/g.79222 Transcript_24998/m.79222 type:complete len:479 (+) Transcript_24998:675-2111(+)